MTVSKYGSLWEENFFKDVVVMTDLQSRYISIKRGNLIIRDFQQNMGQRYQQRYCVGCWYRKSISGRPDKGTGRSQHDIGVLVSLSTDKLCPTQADKRIYK